MLKKSQWIYRFPVESWGFKTSMNKIQSKNHIARTHEVSLPCFDDEIYILDKETDALALGT